MEKGCVKATFWFIHVPVWGGDQILCKVEFSIKLNSSVSSVVNWNLHKIEFWVNLNQIIFAGRVKAVNTPSVKRRGCIGIHLLHLFLGMDLGPILERHNAFQWDRATWRTAWCSAWRSVCLYPKLESDSDSDLSLLPPRKLSKPDLHKMNYRRYHAQVHCAPDLGQLVLFAKV